MEAQARARQAKPVRNGVAEARTVKEVKAPMRTEIRSFAEDKRAQGSDYRGFWRSDALPLGLISLMLIILFYFAAVAH